MGAYVFLDPDGTLEFGLHVIVASPTGVTYAHQCAGLVTEVRALEGFAIPLGGRSAAEPLVRFFRRWRGNPPDAASSRFGGDYTAADLEELRRLVAAIPCWLTRPRGEGDERLFLALDGDRLDEITEGWVPVRTAYGPGVLVFENCD